MRRSWNFCVSIGSLEKNIKIESSLTISSPNTANTKLHTAYSSTTNFLSGTLTTQLF